MLKIIKGGKLKDVIESMGEMKPRIQWGGWKYKPTTYELEYYENDCLYYIVDLERFYNNAAILNMIFQINGKRWKEDAVATFIDAIDDIFHPQAYCCSGGSNKKFDPKELCDRYNKRLWSGLNG